MAKAKPRPKTTPVLAPPPAPRIFQIVAPDNKSMQPVGASLLVQGATPGINSSTEVVLLWAERAGVTAGPWTATYNMSNDSWDVPFTPTVPGTRYFLCMGIYAQADGSALATDEINFKTSLSFGPVPEPNEL
jgi:hypothetical protein